MCVDVMYLKCIKKKIRVHNLTIHYLVSTKPQVVDRIIDDGLEHKQTRVGLIVVLSGSIKVEAG